MGFQTSLFREHLSKIVALGALLLLMQAAIARTNTARVQGTVTDATGAALGAAAITVKSLDTGALFKTRSDGAGKFTVSALPSGNYEIDVRAAGFQGQVQRFRLTNSEVRTIRLKLTAKSQPNT